MDAKAYHLKPSEEKTISPSVRDIKDICKSGNIQRLREVLSGEIETDIINILLGKACKYGHIEMVRLLIQDERLLYISNGIYYALHHNHIEIAKLLLQDRRADINDEFSEACYNGHIEIVKLLLSDIRLTDIGSTFSEACCSGRVEVVKLILESGWEVDILDGMFQASNWARTSVIVILANYITAHPDAFSEAPTIWNKNH